MEDSNRRKKGALNLKIQRVVAIRLTIQWLSASLVAIMFALLLQFFNNPTASAEQRAAARSAMLGPMALAMLATAPIAALDLARFSHSIAGPVVRLRRLVGELADGQKVAAVKFRKNDHWHDLADEFNRLSREVERLRELERRFKDSPTNTPATV